MHLVHRQQQSVYAHAQQARSRAAETTSRGRARGNHKGQTKVKVSSPLEMKTSGVGEMSPVGVLVLVLSVGEVHRREAHRQQHEGRAARGAQSREHPDFDEHSLEEGGSR